MSSIVLSPMERQKILDNPDLILLDRELLLAILKDSDFPDQDKLIDIRNIFLKRLGDKLEKLKATNSQIIRHAYENQLGVKKIHQCCLEILETKKVDALLECLCFRAKDVLRVDSIKICLCESVVFNSNFQNCLLVSEKKITEFVKNNGITKSKTVRLRDTVEDKKSKEIILTPREPDTKSEAIMALLVDESFKGLVIFESFDQSTFSIDQSTDYLEFFATIISKHLVNLLP